MHYEHSSWREIIAHPITWLLMGVILLLVVVVIVLMVR